MDSPYGLFGQSEAAKTLSTLTTSVKITKALLRDTHGFYLMLDILHLERFYND